MTDELSATASPRRQWPLWLALLLAAVWGGLIVRRIAPADHLADGISDLIASLMPPLLVALIVTNLLRTLRATPGVTALEARLTRAGDETIRLQQLLQSVDATLAMCAERTEHLAAAASVDGDGLAASALRLSAAAAEIRQSGERAEGVAGHLVAVLPDLDRIGRQIEDLGGRLSNDTTSQLRIIEALLASVQVRGDEVATQADAAIASINKQLAEVDEQSRATTTRIAKRAYALDAAVDGASTRSSDLLDSVATRIAQSMATMDERLAAARAELDAVGEQGTVAIGGRLDHLHAAAGKLVQLFVDCDAQNARLRNAVDDHIANLPAAFAVARDESAVALDEIAARTATVRHGLAALHAPLASSDAAVAALGTGMDRLQQVAENFTATLAAGLPVATEQLGRLETGAGALDRRIADLRAAIAAGEVDTRSVGTLVTGLRAEVAGLGAVDLVLVEDRMNATAALMHDIGRQITVYGALSGQTKTVIEADLVVLDRQLRTAHGDSEARLAAMSNQIADVRGAIDDLVTPIGAARRMMGDIEAQVAQSDHAAGTLGEQLSRQLASTAAGFATMQERGTALLAEAAALQVETRAGGAAIATISEQFASERATFTTAAASLGTEFDRIRDVLAALETDAARVAAGTADALGQTFERARILADANAAALRELLATIVAEAEHSLDETGSAVAARAFSEPIRRELAVIGDASDHAGHVAEAAAQRVAGQARVLSTTIDGVADKVAEIETRLDVRARDTLSARSSRLVEMLNAASVDVARLLAIDAGEQAWTRYLKGDRSIFARRTVKLVDRATSDKIARHFAHDPAFNDEASHYLDLFEKLSQRLQTDPDGDALLATVVSSDIGKLYIAIARATGRWSPIA